MFEHFQKSSGFYKTLYKQNMSPMILNAIRRTGLPTESPFSAAEMAKIAALDKKVARCRKG